MAQSHRGLLLQAGAFGAAPHPRQLQTRTPGTPDCFHRRHQSRASRPHLALQNRQCSMTPIGALFWKHRTRHSLPVRPVGILFGNRWHVRHAAMAPFPTQPPQEPPLEQFGVQPIGLCPAMFPRNRDTRGMDHTRLYPARASQKPSRPASKASAMRVIVRPALIAASRQRCSTANSRSGLGSSKATNATGAADFNSSEGWDRFAAWRDR